MNDNHNDTHNIHVLTHLALLDLEQAFLEGEQRKTESRILRAMVTLKQVHDLIRTAAGSRTELDPEEYCCAL